MSTFIIDRSNRFGNHQEDYLKSVNSIVEDTAKKIHEAVDSKKDLQELFHRTLAFFGKARKEIARKHRTENAEDFGTFRNEEKTFKGATCLTSLRHPYEQYNQSMLKKLQRYLKTMDHTLFKFEQTYLKIDGPSCLGRASSLEFSLATYEKPQFWNTELSKEDFMRICKLCEISPSADSIKSGHSGAFFTNKVAMQKLKKASIQDYKRVKILHAINHIRQTYPERMSDWAHITLRLQVDNKMYALSQYLVWMNRTFREDPVDYMTDHSTITIIHQDAFLIDAMLKDIAKIFKDCIEWDGKDIQTLKNRVALLQYELAHAMPFQRGSAATAEWFEMAIYLYHGLTLKYNSKKMVNLEALTSLPDEFIKNYDSMIQLEKKHGECDPEPMIA